VRARPRRSARPPTLSPGWSGPEPDQPGATKGSTPGSYRYLCPVPGHVQKGMTGIFTVTTGS